MNNSITDIFFDLDDTLWNFQKNSALTFDYIFSQSGYDIQLEQFLEVYKPINEDYWARYRDGKIDKSTLRYGRLQDTFKILDFEITNDQIIQISEDYQLYLSEFNNLFPKAEETLKYLFEKYNLHILTNGFKEVQIRKLNNSGISQYFKTLTTPEDVNVKKPHALIFEKALEKAETQKGNSVMVGDNLEADIFGAEQSGWQAIHFNLSEQVSYNGQTIKSLEELKNTL